MKTFRTLAVAAAVAVYLQVVLGSVVRITGSGLGCPDWPLCHGQVVPAFEYHTMIEYAHRLVGTAAGLLMVGTAVAALLLYRRARLSRGLAVAAAGAVLLIVVQGVIGGITVLMKNSPFTVAIHLGNAELVLAASLVVALWASWADRPPAATRDRGRSTAWIATATAATYAVLVSGAVVVGTGASGACDAFPLCGRPAGGLADVHMLHRVLVGVATVAVVGAVLGANRRWRGRGLAVVAPLTLALLLAQAVVGMSQVLLGLPPSLRALHVALGSAVWAGVVLLAGGTWLERERAPHRVAGQARLTQVEANS